MTSQTSAPSGSSQVGQVHVSRGESGGFELLLDEELELLDDDEELLLELELELEEDELLLELDGELELLEDEGELELLDDELDM